MFNAIGFSDSVVAEYASLVKAANRVVIFKLDTKLKGKMELDLDQTLLTSQSSFDDIAAKFPSDQCRYANFNLDYMEGLGRRIKTFFVLWTPSDATRKDKMLYATFAMPVKAILGGGRSLTLQAEGAEAFNYDDLVARCQAIFE